MVARSFAKHSYGFVGGGAVQCELFAPLKTGRKNKLTVKT